MIVPTAIGALIDDDFSGKCRYCREYSKEKQKPSRFLELAIKFMKGTPKESRIQLSMSYEYLTRKT